MIIYYVVLIHSFLSILCHMKVELKILLFFNLLSLLSILNTMKMYKSKDY